MKFEVEDRNGEQSLNLNWEGAGVGLPPHPIDPTEATQHTNFANFCPILIKFGSQDFLDYRLI